MTCDGLERFFSAPFIILDRKYNEKNCQQISVVLCFASAKMTLKKEDKAAIELLFKEKGWQGRRIFKKFPSKNWTHTSIDRLINKIQTTETADRIKGSGRPRTVTTPQNVALIEELAVSQEEDPGSHLSQRKIAQNMNIKRASVQHILSKKIKLKAFKRIRTSRKTANVMQKRKTRSSFSCSKTVNCAVTL